MSSPAQSHYLNQCWLLMGEVLWQLPSQHVPKLLACIMWLKIIYFKNYCHISQGPIQLDQELHILWCKWHQDFSGSLFPLHISRNQLFVVVYWINSLTPWRCGNNFNSSPPSAAYMCQWTGSALVQVMSCGLYCAKPLPEPMLTYWQLGPWEHISVKF